MVLLTWTKTCPEAFLPHLEALATQVRELWDQGRIRAGAAAAAAAVAAAPCRAWCCTVLCLPTADLLLKRPARSAQESRCCCRALPCPVGCPPPVAIPSAAGEKNALQEAIIGAVTAGPPEMQASVVEWVLAGVRQEWSTPGWQAHLASPQAFIQCYTPPTPDGAGGWQVGGSVVRAGGWVGDLSEVGCC